MHTHTAFERIKRERKKKKDQTSYQGTNAQRDLDKHLVTLGLASLVREGYRFHSECNSQPLQDFGWLHIAVHFIYFNFMVLLIASAIFHLEDFFV